MTSVTSRSWTFDTSIRGFGEKDGADTRVAEPQAPPEEHGDVDGEKSVNEELVTYAEVTSPEHCTECSRSRDQIRHQANYLHKRRSGEVTPQERIVWTLESDGMPGRVVEPVTFMDLGDGHL